MSDSSRTDAESLPSAVVIDENTLANIEDEDIRNLILDRMNPDFGLLEVLLKKRVLNRNEYQDVKSRNTSYNKNVRLLELITEKRKFRELFEALRDSRQEHLVNYVTAHGVYAPKYGTQWPLTSREIDILDENQEFFIETMDVSSNELIYELYKVQFLSLRQKDYVSKLLHDHEKIGSLIDILQRSSLFNYWQMIIVLQNTGQHSIADLLKDGGIVVSIHNTIDGDEAIVSREEAELVSQMESLLQNRSADESIRLLGILQLRVLKAQKGKSIVLYVLCQTLDELLMVYKLFKNGELKSKIERFFRALLSRSDLIVATTTIRSENLEKYRKYFEVESSRKANLGEEILALCTEITVEKCIRREEARGEEEEFEEIEEDKEETMEEDIEQDIEEMIGHVAGKQPMSLEEIAVEEEANVEKSQALQSSTAGRTEDEVMAAILRNNFDFFVEFLVPKGLVDQLHAAECLTDEETRYIKTLSSDRDKNDEIVKVIRGVLDKYDLFIKILRGRGQNLVAEVADKGGAVMRVVIMFKRQPNTANIQQKLVDRIHNILSKTVPPRIEVVEILNCLARANIEIIGAKCSRHLLVWLWCRSNSALLKLDELNESQNEDLSRFFGDFFALLLDGGDDIPPIVGIDLDDPDREVVCRSSDFAPTCNLFTEQRFVRAVSSLENDIYVLSQNPNTILIFLVDDPDNIKREIPVSEIKDPVDLVVIPEYIFVSDRGKSCIWQVSVADSKAVPWIKSVGPPFFMSPIPGGNILKLAESQPSTLNIYDVNTKQLSKIPLPATFDSLCHVEVTSAGTFIVSYKEMVEDLAGICEIDSNGVILNKFCLNNRVIGGVGDVINQVLTKLVGGDFQKMSPIHFTLNERDDIFITERSRNGIFVFNSRLKLEEVIAKDSVNSSAYLHYVKSRKQLLVVQCQDGEYKVVIFQQERTS